MQVIRAKLRPPRLSPDLVPRPRLVQQLNSGLSRKLILVSAPAGFGKTTLLSEWSQQQSVPVAWITFDPDDDDLHKFLIYFIAAIHSIYPDSCAESQSLLQLSILPSIATLVPILANEIAVLPGELILVLDDYHLLQQMAIHDLLDRIITYLPPTFHLVLCSRTNPPLSLVVLRAQAQLCELRHLTLSFTAQETRAFFMQGGKLAPDDEIVEALAKRTEGWPAGLRLLVLSAQDHDDLRSFASRLTLGDTDILSYLTEQVLSKQSPALVHFLHCTAIVERFSLQLYAALSPENGMVEQGEILLSQCLRENLFVVALGDGWYRYHAIFRELLLHHHERQIEHQGLAEHHRRASHWLEQVGLLDEAIRQALQAEDDSLAIAIIDRQRIQAMSHEQWSRLEQWLTFFPPSRVAENLILGITQLWLFQANEMEEQKRSALKRLEQQLPNEQAVLDPTIYQTLQGELIALNSELTFNRGDFQAAITQARQGLELLPLQHSHARAVCYIYLSGGLRYEGYLAEAEATLQAATQEARFHTANFVRWIAIPRFVFDLIGLKLKSAETVAQSLRVHAQQTGLMESLCWANYYLGRVAYVENRLDNARHFFEEVIAHRYAAHFTPAVDAFLSLALVNQAQGLPQAAIEAVELLTEPLGTSAKHAPQPLILSQIAHLALMQGRMEEAVAWGNTFVASPQFAPDARSQKVPFTRVQLMLAEGTPKSLAQAALLLPEMQQIARKTGSLMHLTQLLVFQALLHDQLGEREAALATLEEALMIALPSRAIRLFADLSIDGNRRLRSLLHDLKDNSDTHAFARHLFELLSAAPLPAPQGPPPLPSPPSPPNTAQVAPSPLRTQALVETLTQREREVLMLIDQGMSNKEIARHLVISEKTVENHTANLYQKLDVRSRIQAVRRAKELNLLPPNLGAN